MKTMNIIKEMALCVPFLLASCNNNEELVSEGSETKVLFTVDEFESATITRTTVDPNNNYAITWASGDAIGIFPREGYQEPFVIPADQVGKSTASFDGGYWALKEGLTYNAYYPFDKANFESAEMKTQIPVTYLGQEQDGTACGIGAYDYTYSDWMTATGGSVKFKFHHIGAFVIFHLEYPATTTYTQLTLSADADVIPTSGTYDLTANEVNFVADNDALTNSISLTLKNCSGTAGETGTFYMMLPPMDFSGRELTLTLTSSAGTTCSYSIEPFTIVKAKKYELTGAPIESNVEGTIDGWVEDDAPTYQAVDLGLSVKWATCNVGASSPEEYGGYYAWGETEEKSDYSWGDTYKWCNGSMNSMTKYCTNSNYGTVDNKTVLDLEDDVAHVKWGGSWRMPTLDEIQELVNKCTWKWTSLNGVNGQLVTGPNGNSIFLPAAGYRRVTDLLYRGTCGSYWSATLSEYYTYCACNLVVDDGYGYWYNNWDRGCGHTVRPVTE